MISYKPFSDFLRKSGYTMEDVVFRTGIPLGHIRTKLNNNEYIPMEYLDQLCKAFNLKVEQVIEYAKGEQRASERVTPDWERIDEILGEKGFSIHKLSEKCLLSDNTLYQSRKRGSRVHISILKNVASVLGVEVEGLVAAKAKGVEG